MYGSNLFDNNEDNLNFYSYKRCMIITFLILNFVYIILENCKKNQTIFHCWKIQRISSIIHVNRTHVKIKIFSASNLLMLPSKCLLTFLWNFVKEVKPFKAFSSKSYSKLLLTAFASRYYRKVPVDKSNKGFSCNQPIDQL